MTTTTADPSNDWAHEALVRQFYVPFNTGEVGLYDTILAPDWVDDPLAPGQRSGPGGLKDLVAQFRSAVPDYHVINDEILVAGDRVAVHSTVRGTHRGAFFGVPATGRPVTLRTCDFHRIAGGVIVATWHLEDFFAFLQQVGALPTR